ncbi:guanylate-binding protein 1 [Misgurnus anguillicaudatus]|uniref:guanylate-binding protein 1 n=1 Tax=Misgurnus anguillicaudatus TaxID=75329 RepID=UPI003CCF0152
MSCRLMSAPVCLIDTDVKGMLCVNKDAKVILDGIAEPVVVVSVVGLYRTGKSYLMNRLAGHQSGFALGNTIESKTKGIWMWCVPHPSKAGHTLVLLDTEGLGDVDKGDEKHDTWIFCLALLLSSTLVYNSLGVIDNMALERLQYMTELREHIRIKAKQDNMDESEQYLNVFPTFVWTVRDFCLELEKDDKPITADQYLEGALEPKPGDSDRIEQCNLRRRCLQNFFVTRKCFVFPRPATPKDMKRMEKLTEAELDPEFLQQANVFCEYIYSSAPSKTMGAGCTVTGTVLGNLAKVYVESIRSGSVPCLENAVISLAKIHNKQAVNEALQLYGSEMLKSIQFPVDPKQLTNIHESVKKNAIEVFMRQSFNDTDQTYQQQLAMNIQTQYERLCEQNKEESKNLCQSVLQCVFEPLENSLRNKDYMKPGGHRRYRDTLTQLSRDYRSKIQTQIMSEEVLGKYLEEKEETGRMIQATDDCLTAAEHQKELERQRRLILEREQREREAENRRQKQILEEQQRAHEEHMRQLMEKQRLEEERIRQENERLQEARLREQERLLQERHQQEAAELQMMINRMHASHSSSSDDCCIL